LTSIKAGAYDIHPVIPCASVLGILDSMVNFHRLLPADVFAIFELNWNQRTLQKYMTPVLHSPPHFL